MKFLFPSSSCHCCSMRRRWRRRSTRSMKRSGAPTRRVLPATRCCRWWRSTAIRAMRVFPARWQPTEYLRRCPYLTQVLASLGATVGRSRLMRLAGQAEVSRHADQGYYWAERVRVHVPIVTQPTVRFECGGAAINMAAGECWIFDTWRQHRVLNDATASRDPSGGRHHRRGRLLGPGRSRPSTQCPQVGAWMARRSRWLLPADRPPNSRRETVNMPVVMNPWELDSHFGLLFADAVPHPNLNQVRARTQRFIRTWRGLWFRYGDRARRARRFPPGIVCVSRRDRCGGKTADAQQRTELVRRHADHGGRRRSAAHRPLRRSPVRSEYGDNG